MPRDPIPTLRADGPVLIAGPTASGKSALALRIAQAQGGVIVNADALQVYGEWDLLTARPRAADLARAQHRLYGHVGRDADYSVGHWLRDLEPLLEGPERPIIVGGTGLYFRALTEGLADIPATPPEVRAAADALSLDAMRDDLDAPTAARIDLANRARVQRAWEVRRATGRGLADWQDSTPPPRLPLSKVQAFVVQADKDWLTGRITQRFDLMMEHGALEEVRRNLPGFDTARPGDRAIGAPELAAHLRGEIPLEAARQAAIIATRQYAKRQRTWFRARMKQWTPLRAEALP